MEKCLAKFANTFNGAWASGGPILFQKALDAICNLQHNSKSSLEVYNAENCKGMQVLPAK